MLDAKILLVDDETAFVEAMIKRLEKRQLIVSSAFSGQQALDFLEKNAQIDIVILDVKMPGMDGIDTLREIKNRFPLVEVIMLTGHATVGSAIEGMKKGAFDYLMKPCEMEVLLAKVDEAFAKKKQHEEKITEAYIKEITARRAY